MFSSKSVGDMPVTYYDALDGRENAGRIRSIGNTIFTYYGRFNSDYTGKLKSIGNNLITYYYNNTDSNAIYGKLRSIGRTRIIYFDDFDADENKGKIKAITGAFADVKDEFLRSGD